MNNIFFDFDGTLIDTWPGIEATLKATFQSLDLKVRDEEITSALVGMPLMRVFEKVLDGDPARADLALQKYRELFPLVGMSGSRPFDGAVRMLEDLKKRNRSLYLVTARNEAITKQMMVDHGLAGLFSWVRGEREGELPDGKAHMMTEVLQKFGIDQADCIMVGDRRYDMEAALANGIGAVGVTYGYGTREELVEAGAGKLVDSVGDLAKILMVEG